ncbi:hypothetical protein F5Y06DRAFT_268068 [Hypoxylon sp. FL0890]|nr:hypothetical protein F5Y06DRAFT_268068 [Hypoxylon sp. FL0890]
MTKFCTAQVRCQNPSHTQAVCVNPSNPADSSLHPLKMKEEFDTGPYTGSEFGIMSTEGDNSTPTPTNSDTMADSFETDRKPADAPQKETVPWPGNTYIIRDPKSGRQITLVDGELRLEYHLGNQGGYHWQCIEKDGWLGFRSPSDNLHIGHDNCGNFIAQKTHHRDWEYFNTRAHPDGGHLLLTRRWNVQRKMTIGPDGQKLMETDGHGTAWQFEKVPNVAEWE